MQARVWLRAIRQCARRISFAILPLRPRDFEQQIYSAIVKPGSVVFDVGANLGHVAVFLARLVGPRGRVIAFEPVLESYSQLVQNIASFSLRKANITPMNHGLSETTGFAVINLPGNTHELASLAPAERWSVTQQSSDMRTSTCSFYALDDYLTQPQVQMPDFIKIDVEGAERLVLAGASITLARHDRPTLFIELFAPWERAFGYRPWDVLGLLKQHHYELFFACPNGLVYHDPSEEHPFPSEFRDGYNILAIPRNREDTIAQARTLAVAAGAKILAMVPPPQPNE